MALYSKIKDRIERCQTYIDVKDYAAYLIQHPEGRTDLPPSEIAILPITGDEWVDIRDELLSRRASNGSKVGYGSENFVKKSQKKECRLAKMQGVALLFCRSERCPRAPCVTGTVSDQEKHRLRRP